MALAFETHVRYGDLSDGTPCYVLVKADSFEEMHRAAARLAELDRDAAFLREQGSASVVPEYHVGRGHPHFGFTDGVRTVTFGKSTDTGHPVPFFPKGRAGLYTPRQDQPHQTAGAGGDAQPAATRNTAGTGGELVQAGDDGPTETFSRTIVARDVDCVQKALRLHGWTGTAYTMLLADHSVSDIEDLREDGLDAFLADVESSRAQARYIERAESARRQKAQQRGARQGRPAEAGPVPAGASRGAR